MNETPAKIGSLLHRLFTLASLVLILVFFFRTPEKGTIRLVLYLLWMAYICFTGLKIVSDLISGERRWQRNYTTMLDRWQQETRSRAESLRIFFFTICGLGLVKLIVPILLYVV